MYKIKCHTTLTGIKWKYIKMGQKEFEAFHPSSTEELAIGLFKEQ
jgi:hypothetical protein